MHKASVMCLCIHQISKILFCFISNVSLYFVLFPFPLHLNIYSWFKCLCMDRNGSSMHVHAWIVLVRDANIRKYIVANALFL